MTKLKLKLGDQEITVEVGFGCSIDFDGSTLKITAPVIQQYQLAPLLPPPVSYPITPYPTPTITW